LDTAHHTELALATRLIAGDARAFDSLYNLYYEAVFNNALGILKDHAAAEDIVQDVFLALWVKRNTLNPENIAGWLFVTGSNKSLNYLRKRLREKLNLQTVDPLPDIAYIETDFELADRQIQLLRKAIDAMPPQRKRVFELCKLKGSSYEETALELNISKNTVKTHMSTALDSIKRYMLQENPGSVLISSLLVLLSLNYI
jgi:RNA polymerase sigma-70 factor (family 1)